jgi:hypothetical protein
MDMKLRTMVILGLLLLAAGCKKRCSREYDFEFPVSVYPVREAYHVGDTLWVDMHFPDVFDVKIIENGRREYHETVQLKNYGFRTTEMQILELKTKALPAFAQEPVWDTFTSIHVSGDIQWEGKRGMGYVLSYSDGMYSLKIGLVCNEAGTYLFTTSFDPPNPRYKLDQPDITPECETEILNDIVFPVNRQPDGTYLNNYHLFEQFMDTTLERDLERIRTASFTFEVK